MFLGLSIRSGVIQVCYKVNTHFGRMGQDISDFHNVSLGYPIREPNIAEVQIEIILPTGIIDNIADTIWSSPTYHGRAYECIIWPVVIIIAHS